MPGLRGCEFVNAAAEYGGDSDPARILAVEQRKWIRDITADMLARLGHTRPASWPSPAHAPHRRGDRRGLDHSESAFPRFPHTWNTLVDTVT